jgi:hypothetical protein
MFIFQTNIQWHLNGKDKGGLNSSKALNGRETDLDPKVKDGLIKHILYLEECMFGLSLMWRALCFK